MRPYAPVCRCCLNWRRAIYDRGICWLPERHRQITHEEFGCDQHARKVIRIGDTLEPVMVLAKPFATTTSTTTAPVGAKTQ